jgi:hypothetical protein
MRAIGTKLGRRGRGGCKIEVLRRGGGRVMIGSQPNNVGYNAIQAIPSWIAFGLASHHCKATARFRFYDSHVSAVRPLYCTPRVLFTMSQILESSAWLMAGRAVCG